MKPERYNRTLFCCFALIVLVASLPGVSVASTWRTIQVDAQTNISVEVVSTIFAKRRGLGGRSRLERGKGMLFIYDRVEEQVFWMKGMLISIDIIWILKGKVVYIEHSVPPASPMSKDSSLRRYGKGIYSDMVLEVPAGYAKEISLSQGSSIQLLP